MSRGTFKTLIWLAAMIWPLATGCASNPPAKPDNPPPAVDIGEGDAGPGTAPADTADPDAPPKRIKVRTFDELMELRPEWIDPALGNLLMAYESGFATREEVLSARRSLDEITQRAAREINLRDYRLLNERDRQRRDKQNAEKIVSLLVGMGFGFDKEDPEGHKPENLFLHQVLKRRRGYCVSLSLLALAVAHYLDVPLHGVRAPGHLFVRFGEYGSFDDETRNFEMTDSGGERENRHYIHYYRVHPQAIVNGAFLMNLDGRQVFSDVTSNLGSLFMLRGNVPAAIEWYQRAVKLDPDNPQAHYNLGTAFTRNDDPGSAIARFRAAIAVNPGDYLSLCARGQLYFEQGDPTIGFEDVASAIALRPDDPHALVLRGVLYAKSGNTEQAEKDFRLALKHDPDDVPGNRNLALLFARENRLDDARKQIDRFLKLAPDDPDAPRLRAWLDSQNPGGG